MTSHPLDTLQVKTAHISLSNNKHTHHSQASRSTLHRLTHNTEALAHIQLCHYFSENHQGNTMGNTASALHKLSSELCALLVKIKQMQGLEAFLRNLPGLLNFKAAYSQLHLMPLSSIPTLPVSSSHCAMYFFHTTFSICYYCPIFLFLLLSAFSDFFLLPWVKTDNGK